MHQVSPLAPTGLPGAEQKDDVPAMNHLAPERASGFPWIPMAVGLAFSCLFLPVPSGRGSRIKAPVRENFELSARWGVSQVQKLVKVCFCHEIN